MEPRVSIVTLGVADLARARKFYEDGLGWKPAPGNNGICFFQLGGLVLALFPRDALAADAQVASDGAGFDGVTLAYNVREKEEVDAALALAEKAGGKVTKPARATDWGGYGGYFADPDGHLWEVAFNPFFPLTDRGEVVLPY